MEPLGFLLGAATFKAAVMLKKPLRKTAVFAVGQVLAAADQLKSTAYEIKEEMEDIIAEAQYENEKIKRKTQPQNIPDEIYSPAPDGSEQDGYTTH